MLPAELEPFQYIEGEEPIQMPRPDERHFRTAAKKLSGLINKSQQQAAFAAQNLEDMVMYDVDYETCGECARKINLAGHYT